MCHLENFRGQSYGDSWEKDAYFSNLALTKTYKMSKCQLISYQ